ncbi:MAG: PAQR family membrane homeostasis protein TrhA [Shimia sp.]
MAYMYTRAERVADATMHLLGFGTMITATVLLLVAAARYNTGLDIAAVSVYGAAAITVFVISALYHLTPWSSARPVFHRLDHAAIYIKIAGTYTPLVVLLGTLSAYILLAAIWVVALIGAVGKITNRLGHGRASTALYIAMGWASVLLLAPLAQFLPTAALGLMIAGGLLYTIGSWFNHRHQMRFNMAIWHGFVVSGSSCFAVAIFLALRAVAGA